MTTVLFAPSYGFNLTGGDIADRYGFNNRIGLLTGVKLKNSLTIDVDVAYLFGNQLKDTTAFDKVINSYGKITSMDGEEAVVLFLMRGAVGHVSVGRVFPKIGGFNPNSGLWLSAGVGMLLHKTRIESIYDAVPQLEGVYKLGYDKLTMGFSTKQFVGYMFHGNRTFLNFYGGLEFVQGYTRNIRKYNFDIEGPDNESKLDFLYTVRVGWLIPLYKRTPQEYYID